MINTLNKWIISASGWRTIFAESGDEQDFTQKISIENAALLYLAGKAFSTYIMEKNKTLKIILGIDTRPTGPVIASIMNQSLKETGIQVLYTGITAAPEIMAFAKKYDGFVYVSASHNPVGHNGIKFGLNDGGVLPGSEAKKIADLFHQYVEKEIQNDSGKKIIEEVSLLLKKNPAESFYFDKTVKADALKTYFDFIKETVSDFSDKKKQDEYFSNLTYLAEQRKISIVADMNGSARCLSIDKDFFNEYGIGFETINDIPGKIAHEIIPEPENLCYAAKEMEKLHASGKTEFLLGYMPDCDGDRGNVVYWDEVENKAKILKAQEVFALCVMSELASQRLSADTKNAQLAVAVNDATSMRIEEIAKAFDAKVFRAEVGEANVVNLARKLRTQGYKVKILGEGSNGGNITHPAAVRDPLNTLFSLIKLIVNPEIFKLWCEKTNQTDRFKPNATLTDICRTLPVYTTTGVTESRAKLQILTKNHSQLKAAYQSVLDLQWQNAYADFSVKYGIMGFETVCNVGTEETRNLTDFTKSGTGGLKLIFLDMAKNPVAFVWMRGSGTESVFRVMCDVKGDNPQMEKELLEWHTKLIKAADSIA